MGYAHHVCCCEASADCTKTLDGRCGLALIDPDQFIDFRDFCDRVPDAFDLTVRGMSPPQATTTLSPPLTVVDNVTDPIRPSNFTFRSLWFEDDPREPWDDFFGKGSRLNMWFPFCPPHFGSFTRTLDENLHRMGWVWEATSQSGPSLASFQPGSGTWDILASLSPLSVNLFRTSPTRWELHIYSWASRIISFFPNRQLNGPLVRFFHGVFDTDPRVCDSSEPIVMANQLTGPADTAVVMDNASKRWIRRFASPPFADLPLRMYDLNLGGEVTLTPCCSLGALVESVRITFSGVTVCENCQDVTGTKEDFEYEVLINPNRSFVLEEAGADDIHPNDFGFEKVFYGTIFRALRVTDYDPPDGECNGTALTRDNLTEIVAVARFTGRTMEIRMVQRDAQDPDPPNSNDEFGDVFFRRAYTEASDSCTPSWAGTGLTLTNELQSSSVCDTIITQDEEDKGYGGTARVTLVLK